MKKFLFIILASVTFYGCPHECKCPPEIQHQEVSFSTTLVNPGGGLKNGNTDVNCADPLLEPAFAKVMFAKDDGTGLAPDMNTEQTIWPKVFEIDGQLYTQAIKLDLGRYWVTSFGLYDTSKLNLIMASPVAGSEFAIYTSKAIKFDFDLSKFVKTQVNVEVLCYIPENNASFGFDGFQTTQILIREQCFFGDLGVNETAKYQHSIPWKYQKM